jgi:translation initiation factor 2 alpha subunit (eIF-2alpha)
MEHLEEGDIVLGTVDRIMGTVVFVKLDDVPEEGTIIESEITSGRVKNIRDYVVPKKRVVCKVLKLIGNNIHLSMRRVSPKEAKEVLEKESQERSYKSILKSVLKEKAPEIIEKIDKTENIYNLIEESKENTKKLESLVGKDNSKKIMDIILNQKQKKAIIKKEIYLKTITSNGIERIKELLRGLNTKYIAAGKYLIISESPDLKTADNNLKKILEDLEKKAKKLDIEFLVKS